jgi:hypothetical protein
MIRHVCCSLEKNRSYHTETFLFVVDLVWNHFQLQHLTAVYYLHATLCLINFKFVIEDRKVANTVKKSADFECFAGGAIILRDRALFYHKEICDFDIRCVSIITIQFMLVLTRNFAWMILESVYF